MTKTVLVAGAAGYLGKFAVRAFERRGYRVRALTRSEGRLGRPGPSLLSYFEELEAAR